MLDSSPSPALKFDGDKPALDLLPPTALEEIANVFAFGAEKYAAFNWRGGFEWRRLIGASLRHIFAFMRGEDNDPESGYSHLAHAGCCVLMLLSHVVEGLGEDNRAK